ncbi:MAG: hypothetical protein ACHQAX_09250 [Gammaproteobacteria bacterium]
MNLTWLKTLTFKSVAIALIATHALPVLFVMYMESVLNQWLPCLFVALIPLFFILYTPTQGPVLSGNVVSTVKIIGMAICSVMALFLIGYFSTTFQPPIQSETKAVSWVLLPGAENMAYVLRLFLQTWLFALVCVMASRWFKQTPDVSGFLSRYFPKRELMPWILDITVIGGVYMVLTVIMVLAAQQLFYLLSRMVGISDLFAFPQVGVFVFLFSLFMMNKALGFSKRVINYAKKPNAKLAFVYIAFIGFMSGVWVFSQFALQGLPDGIQLELHQAMNISMASLEAFEQKWPLLLLSCSFFMVAPLSVALSRLLSSGSKLLLGVALVAPIAIAAFFLMTFPAINAAFWSWMPTLHFATVPVTDALAQFRFNGFSILLLTLVVLLLSVMGSGSLLMGTLVSLLPNSNGRRENRVRKNIAQFFRLICFMCGMFSVLGVYGLAVNVSIYLPTAITAAAVLIGMALYERYQQVQQKRKTVSVCMEVK